MARKDEVDQTVMHDGSTALGTLAPITGLIVAGPNMQHGGTLISVTGVMNLRGKTAGDSNVIWGFCSKELTLAELDEAMSQQGPLRPAMRPETEIQNRHRVIRMMGVLDTHPAGVGEPRTVFLKNEKVRLAFGEDASGWNIFFYLNNVPALTTGSNAVWRFWYYVKWDRRR